MAYVEWLRVRGVLKWTAIVLVVLLAIAGAFRLSVLGMHSDALSFVHAMEHKNDSRVTHVTLPDGGRRTVIDNARDRVHVVVDDYGYAGKRIRIVDSSSGDHPPKTIVMGSMHVESSTNGRQTITTVETNRPERVAYDAAFATFVALILATILGAPFARENEGHLEIAFTKPIDRTALALRIIGVDLLGLLIGWLMTEVALILAYAMFQAPHFTFSGSDAIVIALGWCGVAAWYGLLCAATASMRRAFGVILGLAWPVSIVLIVLAKFRLGSSLAAQAVHGVATVFGVVHPWYYLHFGPPVVVDGRGAGAYAISPALELPVLFVLAIVYLLIAVVQWRRVEA
jgi:hypothetical protein